MSKNICGNCVWRGKLRDYTVCTHQVARQTIFDGVDAKNYIKHKRTGFIVTKEVQETDTCENWET